MLSVEDRLTSAKNHLDAGRTDSAAVLYESVLDISPVNVEALTAMARITLEWGDRDTALSLAREAAQRGADEPETLCRLATIALALDVTDIAEAAVDQALSIGPGHAEGCRLKAIQVLEQGDVGAAERVLQQALDRDPDNADLAATLSEVYMRFNLAGPALELAQRALQLGPDRPEFMALVGGQLAALGDHAKAVSFLQDAYLRDPSNPEHILRLADTQFALGESSDAYRMAKRAVTLFPQMLPAWTSYVRLMIYRGEGNAALAEFATAARRHPDRVTALLTLASAHLVAGEAETAARLVQPLAAPRPGIGERDVARANALLRDCHLSRGAFDAVKATFTGVAAAPETGTVDYILDPGMTSLEAMVLARLAPGSGGDAARLCGPGGYGQLLGLVDGISYVATDVPDTESARPAPVVRPLSAVLSEHGDLRAALRDAVPFVTASETRRDVWRRSMTGLPRPLVALAWEATRPGVILEDLRSVLDGFAGTLIGLQWDGARHQLAAWPEIIDAGVHLHSLDDLAAVIAECDGVIGPDGIPLHIAGAMGRPGAVLCLPNRPWYWHAEDGRATWYPSVSVLEAPAFGNWSTLMPSMSRAIADFVEALGGTAGPTDRRTAPLAAAGSA